MNTKPKKPRKLPQPRPGSISKATPETAKHAPKYIPLEKIRELIEIKELNTVQAASVLGCTPESIRLRCIKHGIKYGLKRFKETKADILASKQRMILESLDADAIKSMAVGTRATAFGILFDKERLERGQSTANIAYNDMTKKVSELDKEMHELAQELGDVVDEDQEDQAYLPADVSQYTDDFDFDEDLDAHVPENTEDID